MTLKYSRSFPLLCVLLLGGSLAHSSLAQDSSPIEERMSAAERRETGLDKLSTAERRALNRWLQQQGLPAGSRVQAPAAAAVSEPAEPARPAAPAATARPAAPAPAPEPAYGERREVADVESTIDGEFNGWDGKTVFRLANGQVYQQRRPGRWKTSLMNPEVRISKSFFGYEMEVDGHSIGVKRLR